MVGQVKRRWCLHRSGATYEDDISAAELVRVLSVVVAEGEFHRLDLPRPGFGQLLEEPGLLLRREPQVSGEAIQDRTHQVHRVHPARAGFSQHQAAQFVRNECMENQGIMANGFLNHGAQLL